MHTDDDIFESLNLDEIDDVGPARPAGKAPAPGTEKPKSKPANDSDSRTSAPRRTAATRKPPRELNTADSSVDRGKLDREKAKKKKSRLRTIIVLAILEVFTLIAIFAYGYFLRNWNLIQRIDVRPDVVENKNISVEKKEEMEKGYWNVAVFGVDARNNNLVEKGLNSDVIMIVSINRETGDIKLVSVFRDTYLNITEKNLYNKINAAYAMGGPEQALAAINKNLDLNIYDYAVFNWKAVVDGINILGGIDGISLSKAELYYINAYITETVKVTKVGSYQLKKTGEQHLDGVQAVAYARLRYMDNDYARTERQRNVIKACFKKALTADFSVLNNIMVTCFPQVATNINFNNIVAMAQNIKKYNIADTGGFPWQRGEAMIKDKGDCVVPATLESNVIKLHEFLFSESDYKPSEAVIRISNNIKDSSGIYREGQVIESVSTDGGFIQKPKESAASSKSDSDKDDEKPTIGVDEDGNYIYPTDEDGNIISPTDEDGKVVYPTDEDGNVIKESSNSRPTELDDENAEFPGEDRPDESEDRPGSSNNSRPGAANPSGSGNDSPNGSFNGDGLVSPTGSASPHPAQGDTNTGTLSPQSQPNGPSNPGYVDQTGGAVNSGDNIISPGGPGSITTNGSDTPQTGVDSPDAYGSGTSGSGWDSPGSGSLSTGQSITSPGSGSNGPSAGSNNTGSGSNPSGGPGSGTGSGSNTSGNGAPGSSVTSPGSGSGTPGQSVTSPGTTMEYIEDIGSSSQPGSSSMQPGPVDRPGVPGEAMISDSPM